MTTRNANLARHHRGAICGSFPALSGLLFLVSGCAPSVSTSSQADASVPPPCQAGELSCEGATLSECVNGEFQVIEECEQACSTGVGCTLCTANEHSCNGDMLTTCTPDGSRFVESECDPVQGLQCSADGCTGACSPDALGTSYIGCEYFPTVTANLVRNAPFLFAVTVSNTQNTPANVTIEGANLDSPVEFVVPANDVVVRRLDWQDRLKDSTGSDSIRVDAGSYRLRSDQPVTVYQFSPLNYQIDGIGSHSNDASLLYPTNALGKQYRVASWPNWISPVDDNSPGLMAVTAVQDATKIQLTTTTDIGAGDMPVVTANVPQEVILNRGDVLELFARQGDLTGSEVVADRPIQVIGGHACTNIPAELVACDHLEEAMLPVEVLGARYIVTPPAVTSLPGSKVRHVRIIATAADTSLTFDPPQPGVPALLAAPGDFAEIASNAVDFSITSSERVLVAEYMNGLAAGSDREGDPALSISIPVEQFRRSYLFHAPPSYESNFVNIVAPTGSTISLDGATVSNFVPVGSSGYSVAKVLLGPGQGGNHNISGSEPFGISVYGYGLATSYWYPGGLNLVPIPVD